MTDTRRRKTHHICATLQSWKNYILKWAEERGGNTVRDTGRLQGLKDLIPQNNGVELCLKVPVGFFFFFSLCIYFETERVSMGEAEREREKRISSRLSTVSTESDVGLHPTTPGL